MKISKLQKKMNEEYDIVCWRTNNRPTAFYLNSQEFDEYISEVSNLKSFGDNKAGAYFRGTPVYKNTRTNFI